MAYTLAGARTLRVRLEEAIKKQPDLTNSQLRARFGCSDSMISEARRKLGLTNPGTEYLTETEMRRAKRVYARLEDPSSVLRSIPRKD